jgi:lysozyme
MSSDVVSLPGARGLLAGLLLVAALASACGVEAGGDAQPGAARTPPSSTPSSTASSPTTPSSAASPSPSATTTPSPRRRLVRGVDVSHHQGVIDWVRVRRDGIEFAYLKATEGSSFTDPRFVASMRAAMSAGLRVGGYHYFTLCSPGVPQAEHFADVLGSTGSRGSMPPAVDLELLGNCDDPPARVDLLREVRAFVDTVEARTGQRVVVYAYPEFEERFRIATALQRRQWVRDIGSTPPTRKWWIWQKDDRAGIDGIAGPADLNVMVP